MEPDYDEDITWEEALARRTLDQAREAVDEGMDRVIGQNEPPMHQHTTGLVGTATTANTTWSGTTVTPGNLLTVVDGGSTGIEQPYLSPYVTTYTSPVGLSVDEEQMKRLIKEAMKEMFEEDVSFMRWLHIKYMTIPVRPRKAAKRNGQISQGGD